MIRAKKPVLATSLLVLSAFAGPALAKTTVDFTVAEYSSKTGPYFEEVAAAFEAENPDIDINIEVVPWDTLLQRLTTDITGGTAPDISIIGTRWLLDFAEQGIAEPVDEYLTPEFKDTFIDTFMAPSVIDGKIMGLPVAASARAMIINADLYEKAGVSPPTTWDELYEASKKISELPDTYGLGLQGKEIETDAYFYYALWTHGGDILTEDGMSGLDSPEAIEAATLYKKMLDEGLTQPSPTNYSREDVFNLFKQGTLGTIFTFPMLIPQLQAEAPDMNYQVLPFPEKASKATYGVTDTLMLFSDSDVKEEAWKFIEFAYGDEWRSKFDRGEGFLPVTKNVAAEEYFTADKDVAGFAAGLPYAKFAPTIANWEEIADTTVRALQQIYLGQETPEAALTAAAAEINKIRGK
ncbi:ABC transporter substrate-binding protein [Aliiruegeria lutimaris]|uniref:Carbohydrate ABC transporter substrate-binding protein, CUT1 family n=1 Tax=Aliiruegeria lutimaris TaxID=571298 RepID=A0A1G9DB72_9RHOB|nr:sugar ABC transporter substrate-binding protein [Aliiruegeria lutimaris]SDK61053.1 carbohydrate ABC transporter substrate-binding protein, CUT1 family [Aliiruegeria lutimaris]